jgi:hypothetical protein
MPLLWGADRNAERSPGPPLRRMAALSRPTRRAFAVKRSVRCNCDLCNQWAALDRALAKYDWLLITLAIGLLGYGIVACWLGRGI